jgi:uncharacterized UPF0160 family protein
MIGVTHDGQFHADDVFATVVLRRIFPGLTVVRSRDPEKIANAGVVYEVGRIYDPAKLRFDHHQNGALVRENGITYSSFGLVWLKFGMEYCGNKNIAEGVDKSLAQSIDADDNGIKIVKEIFDGAQPFVISQVIHLMNPVDEFETASEEIYLERFIKTVDWAEQILDRLVLKLKASEQTYEAVSEVLKNSSDKRFVVMEKPISPRGLGDKFPELLYVVFPGYTDGRWWVRSLEEGSETFTARAPFPRGWAGLDEEKLEQACGVKGAYFAHKNRFLVVMNTREGALEVVHKMLDSL